MAADGGVGAMRGAGEFGDDGFEAGPEIDAFEERVHEIGDGAVIGVLWVGVVESVVARGLEEVPVLELGDEPAVFGAGAVRPLVDFVGVDAEDGEPDELPAEEAAGPSAEEQEGAGEEQVAGTLPPGEAREVAREVVVHDVGADEERADDGCVLGEVGVFGPVHEAGDEVGQRGDEDDLQELQEGREEEVHGSGGLRCTGTESAGALPEYRKAARGVS